MEKREEVVEFSGRGEIVKATKKSRGRDDETRVTEIHYPQLTGNDISLLQMVFGLVWAQIHIPTASPYSIAISDVPGVHDWTLTLDFVPRVWSETGDTDALTLPGNVGWTQFTRTFTSYQPAMAGIPTNLAGHQVVREDIRQGKAVFFGMKFRQVARETSPGSFEIEYWLVVGNEIVTAPRERFECFSPVIQVKNPHNLMYLLPYLRIEGRLQPNT